MESLALITIMSLEKKKMNFAVDTVIVGQLFPFDYGSSSLSRSSVTFNLINRSQLDAQVLLGLLT